MLAQDEQDDVSSMDQACSEANGAHVKHDSLLAQLSQQLAALQKRQAQAASAADVRMLDKQGMSIHGLLIHAQCRTTGPCTLCWLTAEVSELCIVKSCYGVTFTRQAASICLFDRHVRVSSHWSTAVAGLRAAAQDAEGQASGLRVGLAEAREELARLQRGREHAARHHRCHVRILSVLKSNQSPCVGLRGAVALLTMTPMQCCRTCHI